MKGNAFPPAPRMVAKLKSTTAENDTDAQDHLGRKGSTGLNFGLKRWKNVGQNHAEEHTDQRRTHDMLHIADQRSHKSQCGTEENT